MNSAMQQFQMMCQQSGNNPLLTIYRQPQPVGRPMRSIQNMRDMEGGSTHMTPPPPPPPIAGAQSELAGTAAGMTPPPPRPPIDIDVSSPMSAPPSPKLAASDGRDAVEVTLKRMLERDKAPKETAEPEAPAMPAAPKKTKTTPKAKTTPTKPKAGKIVKTTPAKPVRNKPTISWETSRNQVMCRTGFSGPGTTHRITFKEAGGAKKAYAMAEKWLAKEMKEYERTVFA